MTAWRVEMTLREFAKPQQTDIWFDYPVHRADNAGRLKDLQPAGYDDGRRWEPRKPKSEDERLTEQIAKTKERNSAYVTRLSLEFENLAGEEGYVPLQDLAKAMGVSYTSTKFRNGIADMENTRKYKIEKEFLCKDGYKRTVLKGVSQ